MISESTKQRAIEAADVYDVLSDFLPELRKKGGVYTCCCPFHSERTPSFTVNPARNRWFCFGCQKGGDAVEFLREHQNMSFSEAIEYLCRKYSIPIEYEKRGRSQEEIDLSRKKESMLIALEIVQQFFVGQLQADTDEARKARLYAYGRWGEEYCKEFGVGYAPQSSQLLLDFARKRALSIPMLIEAGVIAKGDNGEYAFLRQRVTLPIRGNWGKVIAWTGRYIGDRKDVGKYMNLPTTPVFEKSESLFGLDAARKQCRQAGQFIVVEGAPDVMRLQLAGLSEAVAPLGTALTDKHLAILYRYCKTLRFIPDSDPPKGALWGAGIAAVMKNGEAAIRKGFDVYVREIPRTKQDDEAGVKNDPDTYIVNREAYAALEDKHFLIWLGEKRFDAADGADASYEVLRDIASLLIFVTDDMIREMCLDRLCKMFGSKKQWKSAMSEASRRIKEIADEENSGLSKKERDLLRKFGIIIRNNMYYGPAKDEGLERWSNFILIPEFHIKDGRGRRKFTIINEYGERDTLELEQKVFSSAQSFSVAAEKKGNYVWLAKQEKLNTLKEYLYAITDSINAISIFGWQEAGFYAFADGIHTGERFYPIDTKGIVTVGTTKYYLAPYSDTYINDPEALDFEKKLVYAADNPDSLYQFVDKLVSVYGDGAKVGFAWVLSCLFRDVIYKSKDWFPVLNLFGIPGSGKTALASALNSFFFVLKQDPPKLGNTSVPALNYMLSHVANSIVVLDEYTNLISDKVMDILKGLWGGTTNTKINMRDEEGGITTGKVYSGVIMCGQHQPSKDSALLKRCVHLSFHRSVFTEEENLAFTELKESTKLGNAHLTMELLRHRKRFVENFRDTYMLTRRELKQRTAGERINDRIFDNWTCILTSFRIMEMVMSVPFTYKDLFEVCTRMMLAQAAASDDSSETSDLWKLVNALHMTGKVIEGTHYKIDLAKSFRSENSSDVINFCSARKLLLLNWQALQEVIRQRSGTNQMKLDLEALTEYLKHLPYFLGVKQRWFVNLNALGQPVTEFKDNQTRTKSSRARALVFDYEQLCATTDIDLESVAISDIAIEDEPVDTAPATPPPPPSLFPPPGEDEPLPF